MNFNVSLTWSHLTSKFIGPFDQKFAFIMHVHTSCAFDKIKIENQSHTYYYQYIRCQIEQKTTDCISYGFSSQLFDKITLRFMFYL